MELLALAAENLTIGLVVGAALVDSINPCVFGVLIFLIAFMNRVFKTRKMMLLGGLLYSAVVYATYLFLGFGILKITISTGFSAIFYTIAALIAIIAGVIEIKDYFWYGRGFSLQMIPGGAKRIKYYTNKIENLQSQHPALLLLTTALLGVFVVLVELPCTGAPYFAILGLLAGGSYAEAVPMLLLYNFIFIIPLFIIILVAYFGASSETLEKWRKEHRGLMRLGVGIFLIALGIFMLYSLPPIF
jgi:cytochrome c biogenesis protein CcdA